ncbi:MAG: DNA modification methylase [Bryobacteraceae bacterium]|jgi:DNA modification methylase
MQHEIEIWPIDRLVFYVRNPRKNDAAVDRMCASIREFGFKIPVLARSNGEVVDGHLRLKAAKKLDITEIPVILCDEWTPAQVKAFRLMVNRSVAWADWDEELLSLELLDLKELDFELGLTGFDDDELTRLLAGKETAEGLTDEDAVPEMPETPVSLDGDLWIVGDHLLLVGDATDTAAVAKLMAGATADLVFTDPPYNVDYEGYTEERLKISGDRMSDSDFKQFLESAFRSYRGLVKPGASMYVCHSSSWQREFQNAMEAAGFEVRCQIIWAKNTFAWGFGRYKFQHEPIFYTHVTAQKDPWYGDKSQSTLWQEKKPAANRMHPTAKPVELVERALLNSSKSGDIVVDLFGGSGSTLIGCERRGRKARIMEIDPKYCDVIVRRWEEFTGRKATLDGDGATFESARQNRQISTEGETKDTVAPTQEANT